MFIYKFTNKENGKNYIGADSKPSELKSRYLYHKKNYDKDDKALYSAMRKYGFENFDYNIEEDYTSILNRNSTFHRKFLYWREIILIEKYNSYIEGYNQTKGGEGVVKTSIYDGLSSEKKEKRKNQLSEWALEQNQIRWSPDNYENSLTNLKWHTLEADKKRSDTMLDFWENISQEDKIKRFRKMKTTWSEKTINEKSLRANNFGQKRWEYTLVDPEGNQYTTRYLTDFCKKNNISDTGIRCVARGLYDHHKKWKASRREI